MTVKSETNRRVIRAFIGALMGVALVVGSAGHNAFAANDDDDDELPDVKFFQGLLKGLGLKRDGEGSGIDYRERSPLVLPNGKSLPPPETEPATAKNPAWPVDVDVKRAKEAKSKRAQRNVRAAGDELDRPELPSQLNGGNRSPSRTGEGAPTTPIPGGQAEAASNPSTPSQLGTQGIFKSFWAPKEEYATFTGEPARTSLTQPPSGYRTPSAAQPYGVGKDKWVAPKIDRNEAVR